MIESALAGQAMSESLARDIFPHREEDGFIAGGVLVLSAGIICIQIQISALRRTRALYHKIVSRLRCSTCLAALFTIKSPGGNS